jgi:WD40 repeat protein
MSSPSIIYRHPGAVQTLALSPDGQFLAVAGGGSLDMDRRKHQVFKEHFSTVLQCDLAFFTLADLQQSTSDELSPVHTQKGHTGPIATIHWADDGMLWSCGGDKSMRRSNLESGLQTGEWLTHHDAVLAVLPVRLASAAEPPASDSPGSSPQAESAGSPETQGESETAEAGSHLDNPTEGETPEADEGGRADQPLDAGWFEQSECMLPGGEKKPNEETDETTIGATHAFGIGADRYLRLIDLKSGKRVENLEIGKHAIVKAIFFGDGRYAVSNIDGRIFAGSIQPMSVDFEEKFGEPIYSLATSGIKDDDGSVGFWSGDRLGVLRRHKANGEVVQEFTGIEGARVLSLCESADATRLAVGNLRGEVTEFDTASGEQLESFDPIETRATSLLYLPGEERRLVAGDYDGALYRLR